VVGRGNDSAFRHPGEPAVTLGQVDGRTSKEAYGELRTFPTALTETEHEQRIADLEALVKKEKKAVCCERALQSPGEGHLCSSDCSTHEAFRSKQEQVAVQRSLQLAIALAS